MSESNPISLVLHTAVDFSRKAGNGLGIIQRAITTGNSTFPKVEQKHGVERGQVGAKNVKTLEKAYVLALILAMGLARSTLKRRCATTHVSCVTVL